MEETANNKLESVLAGIRGYLTEQLGELDSELTATEQSITELSDAIGSRKASVAALATGRELLLAKLAELDGVTADTAPVAEPVAAVEPAVVAAPKKSATKKSAAKTAAPKQAEPKPAAAPAELNESQRKVLDFLEATPGVHKVAEIAAGVLGADAGSAAVQGIRRALAVLTQAGRAAKSEQGSTAFYSAETPVAAVVEAVVEAPAKPRKAAARKAAAKPVEAVVETAVETVAETVVAKKPAAKKPAAAKQAAAKKPAAEKPVAKKAAPKKSAKAGVPAPRSEAKADGADAPVRADRNRIVATLLAAAEPQSAGDLSRAIMGEEWRPSDATNFRNVLKSLATQGLVAEHREENNRSRYTAVASA